MIRERGAFAQHSPWKGSKSLKALVSSSTIIFALSPVTRITMTGNDNENRKKQALVKHASKRMLSVTVDQGAVNENSALP
jgi:hypothetical protein